MKMPILIMMVWIVSTHFAKSSTTPLPEAPIEARLTTSKIAPFIKETFTLTLEIITRDIEIDPQLDLANLPPHDVMRITGPFEAMAVKRERKANQEITIRKYRATAHANTSGNIDFAPLLQLTSRKRVRSFFGSAMEVRPVTLQLPAIEISIRPIPSPPPAFSGIIGNFEVDISAFPTNITAGDLVTIKTTLQGAGWVNEDLIPLVPSKPLLRTYPVKPDKEKSEADRIHVYEQTVVPISEEIKKIPAIPLVWFNVQTESFENSYFGPFALTYVEPDEPNGHRKQEFKASNTNAWKQKKESGKGSQLTLPTATKVYMAPSRKSISTFTVTAQSQMQILEIYSDWLLIEHANNRGWIPTAAVDDAP